MKLSELHIDQVRNIERAQLDSLADINIIYGENGAGKTTLLEAIHILALARSFRSTGLQPVIRRGADACTVFGRIQRPGQVEPIPVGVHRMRRGGFKIKLAGEDIKSVVRLAQLLPLQIINAASYLLLDGGPKQRRQFLDWGVFHVEHTFYANWLRAQRAVKQRNTLLRARGSESQLSPWNRELADAAESIDHARQRYFDQFSPVFKQILASLTDLQGVELDYRRGWDTDRDIGEVLAASLARDRARGLTHSGPHRADLRVTAHGSDAGQILSRGQQKIVVSALRLAQTRLLQQQSGQRCIMLVDDLPAEMDLEHQRRLCAQLAELELQLFITCISPQEIGQFDWPPERQQRMFHVKHGHIEPA